jgi:peptide-methionine (S)-S-oxide reductase
VIAAPGEPLPAHAVLGVPVVPPFPEDSQTALFGMGCFWGPERMFWQQPGVVTTAVGYAGGTLANPDYRRVCSGGTGHAEVVLIVFRPGQINFAQLLKLFWESHDPTQGMRQGNDIGSQYRSAIFTFDAQQHDLAMRSRALFQQCLTAAGRGGITTEITAATRFWYAEDYHQQYLAKNPAGYCGAGGTGVRFGPVGPGGSPSGL